jgi:hypothetical protein
VSVRARIPAAPGRLHTCAGRPREIWPAGLALACALAAVLVPGAASGHALSVHRQLTRDAGPVWSAIPLEVIVHLEGAAPLDALGAVRYEPGDDAVTGSVDEDREFNYLAHCEVLAFLLTGAGSCEFGPPFTRGFFEHFWDPDHPDVGGPAAHDQGFEDPTVNDGERFASSYRKAQALWDARVICPYVGRDRHGSPCPVDRDEAYYWLGRVAHLLQDLSVPAHVHGIRHDPAAALLGGEDRFEGFVRDEYERGAGTDHRAVAALRGGAYPYEALPGLDEPAAFAWVDVHPEATDLFRLFWYAAQKTQYYGAGNAVLGRAGDGGSYRRRGESGTTRLEPSLWAAEGIAPVEDPAGVAEALPEAASALVPHALRAVAGLYRLFWHETHAIALALSGSRLGPGDLLTVTLVNATGVENTGDLYLGVLAPEGTLWVFDGQAWSATAAVAARPGITLTAVPVPLLSTVLAPPLAEGTYTFFAVLAAPGGDPADAGTWLSNLATAAFTVAAPSDEIR